MSFEFFDNEAQYISKQEISPDAKAKIAKRLGHLATIIS
jgi:hypothetical protein